MKFKRIITIIITGLAVAMVVLSGVMKLSGNADGAKMLEAVGVGQYRVGLGLAEIIFAALFAYPKTMKIGFILLSCYFAGALATELSHHVPLNALTPLVLIWMAALLRDKSIFLPSGPAPRELIN
jgi:hypothetical protein